MKDDRGTNDRQEIADNLRDIMKSFPDRDYARAFARCVLGNTRTGLAMVPRCRDSLWYPRRRSVGLLNKERGRS